MGLIKHLEIHNYAPELNRVYFKKGGSLPVKGCKTIKEVRALLFKPKIKGIVCVVSSVYDDNQYKWLNKVVARGIVDSRLKAVRYCKQFKQAGGPLIDGTILPPNKIQYKFNY